MTAREALQELSAELATLGKAALSKKTPDDIPLIEKAIAEATLLGEGRAYHRASMLVNEKIIKEIIKQRSDK